MTLRAFGVLVDLHLSETLANVDGSRTQGGPTSCQSAVFLPLPWGESADTWGMVVAVGTAVLAYFTVRYLLRRTGRHDC